MKLMLLTDDGELHEVLDNPDGYNLSNPIAYTFFMGALVDNLKRHYDPFVAHEPAPPEREYDPGPEVDDEGGMSEYRHVFEEGAP